MAEHHHEERSFDPYDYDSDGYYQDDDYDDDDRSDIMDAEEYEEMEELRARWAVNANFRPNYDDFNSWIIYREHLRDIEPEFRDRVNELIQGAQELLLPPYPLVDSMDDLWLVNTRTGNSHLVHLLIDQDGSRVFCWKPITVINLYSANRFVCRCGTCEFCMELIRRLANARYGVYDQLDCQITGVADQLSFEDDPMELDNLYERAFDPPVDVVFGDEFMVNELEDAGQPITPVVTVDFKFGEFDCCVCLMEELDGLSFMFSCGHRFCQECYGGFIGTGRCPLCRARIETTNIGQAEGKTKVATDYQVEYSNSAALGDLEYCDPLPWSQLQPGQESYHCYIFRVELSVLQAIDLSGKIEQVRLLEGEILYDGVAIDSHRLSNISGEIQIISRSPVQYRELVLPKVENSRVLICVFGTYGDYRPLEHLSVHLQACGYTVETCGDRKFNVTHNIDFGTLISDYAEQPGLPSIRMLGNIKTIVSAYHRLSDIVRDGRYNLIISNAYMPGVRLVAKQYQVNLRIIEMIPSDAGMTMGIDHNTSAAKFISTWLEYLRDVIYDNIPVVSEYLNSWYNRFGAVLFDEDQMLRLYAPELSPRGLGAVRYGDFRNMDRSCDVLITLGSSATIPRERSIVESLKDEFEVHCQSTKGQYDCSMIDQQDHEELFRRYKVIITSGGIGTVQLALRAGCIVIVDPVTIDQKCWPKICFDRGYPVYILDKKEPIYQIKTLLSYQKQSRTLTTISYFSLIEMIQDIQQTEEETFLFTTSLLPEITLEYGTILATAEISRKVQSAVMGQSCLEHIGIGKKTKSRSGKTYYKWYEFDYIKIGGRKQCCVVLSISDQFPESVSDILRIPININLEEFYNSRQHGYFMCQNSVRAYLERMKCDISPKWKHVNPVLKGIGERIPCYALVYRPKGLREIIKYNSCNSLGEEAFYNSIEFLRLSDAQYVLYSEASKESYHSISYDSPTECNLKKNCVTASLSIDESLDTISTSKDRSPITTDESSDLLDYVFEDLEAEHQPLTTEEWCTIAYDGLKQFDIPALYGIELDWIEDVPHDGKCIHHVFSKITEIDDQQVLEICNKQLSELGLPSVTSIPTYNEDNGDIVLLAYAEFCKATVIVFDIDGGQIYTITGGSDFYFAVAYMDCHYAKLLTNYEQVALPDTFEFHEYEEVKVEYSKPLTDNDLEVITTGIVENSAQLGRQVDFVNEQSIVGVIFEKGLITVSSHSCNVYSDMELKLELSDSRSVWINISRSSFDGIPTESWCGPKDCKYVFSKKDCFYQSWMSRSEPIAQPVFREQLISDVLNLGKITLELIENNRIKLAARKTIPRRRPR